MTKPISASSLATFDACPRKWAWKEIAKIKPEPHPSAVFGQQVHDQIERYYRDGVPFDLRTPAGETALAGHHLLPARGPEVEVEKPFTLIWEGVTFGGRKDLETPTTVLDHKTTKDLRWAKNVEDLANDYQAVIYGVESMVRRQIKRVGLRWVYYRVRPPHRAQAVDLTIGLDDRGTVSTMARAVERGRVMLRLIDDQPHPLTLPPNGDACDAYGGCPYVSLCNLSPGERLRSIMTNEELLAKIAARVNPPTAAEQASAVPVASSPVAPSDDAPPSMSLPTGFVWGRNAAGSWVAFPAALAPAPAAAPAAPVVEAPAAPVVEAPAKRRGRPPKPAPVVEEAAPAPVVETPAPVVEASAPVVEEAAPVVEYAEDLPPVGIEPPAEEEAGEETDEDHLRTGMRALFGALRMGIVAAESFAEVWIRRNR